MTAEIESDVEYATNGEVSLAYERDGVDNDETVLFVEGLGYSRWMWRWQRNGFADHYEVIVPDNRGTGDSETPEGPYTISEMASDLEAVLDDAGVETVHVVGASMGGMIALQYALEYDRAHSLGLLCTSFGGEEAVPIPEETQVTMFTVPEEYDERQAIRHKMGPALSEGYPEDNPEKIERIVDWRLDSDASEQARLWQAEAVEEFDISDRCEEIDVPATVLHGTEDRVVPFENGRMLTDRLPQAELTAIDGGPHLFFIEQADLVTDRLLEFFDDV
jgi:pimeloyl-ACP methyl ester carboxylesterase